MKKIYYSIATFALALVLGASANATVITPPLIELDANRGDQLANTVKIKNDGSASETYYLSVEAFKASGEDGKPEFVEKGDAVEWVSFAFNQVTLQADQSTAIPFTVKVPETARSGGHYVAVFASTTAPTLSGSGVGVSARLGTLILINVAGDTNEVASLAEFSSDKDSYSSLPVTFTTRLENQGNVHVKPYGEIVVRNFFGNEAARIKINEEGGNVLPNSIRKFTSTWGEASQGKGFFAKYKQQKKEKAFGKYSAEATVLYGEGKILKKEISFWVIPVERIIVNIVLLVILILILSVAVKKYNQMIINRYNKGARPKMK